MALITRIARLFKADMHALLDAIEEPQSVLKQAVREMAEAIERSEKQLEDLKRREEKLNSYRAEQEKLLTETDHQIDLCLRANNEKLGRSMVRRKLEIQKRIKLSERTALESERGKLAQELAMQKGKLASIKEKMEIFVEESRHKTAEATRCERDYSVSDDEVEGRFWPRRNGAQARHTAMDDLRRNAAMKRPGLIQGIIVAVVLSLAAPALYHLCDLLVPRLLALKLVIVALTGAYVLYLLKLHHARIGNIVFGTGTALILLAALLWGVATTTLVFVSITLIWIVRSLIAYSSVFMSIVDGALCLLGLGAATWAFGATGSAFWAIWCLFLTQSLFTLIPEQPGRIKKPASSIPAMETDRFSAAHKAAEVALRALARRTVPK